MEQQPERLMTEQELSDYLRVHLETVRRWRRDGTGPPYVMAGPRRPRYRKAAVDEWLERGGPDQGQERRS